MQTLNLQFCDSLPEVPAIQVEPANGCDGSLCHQPLFREDGTLNYVAPHSHLVEWTGAGIRYYAVFCDFPSDNKRATRGEARQPDRHSCSETSLFANYPPFPESANEER